MQSPRDVEEAPVSTARGPWARGPRLSSRVCLPALQLSAGRLCGRGDDGRVGRSNETSTQSPRPRVLSLGLVAPVGEAISRCLVGLVALWARLSGLLSGAWRLLIERIKRERAYGPVLGFLQLGHDECALATCRHADRVELIEQLAERFADRCRPCEALDVQLMRGKFGAWHYSTVSAVCIAWGAPDVLVIACTSVGSWILKISNLRCFGSLIIGCDSSVGRSPSRCRDDLYIFLLISTQLVEI